MSEIMTTVVAAVCLGIAAQAIAARFKLPAIMPLLLLGVAAGPSGIHLFEPESLGEGLEVLIHLGVAVILFEGGLSLDPDRLRRVGGALRNLLTIGVFITGLGGAALAHFLLDMPWPTAALFGAIVTVTGPTVIAPLLRYTIAPRKVKTLLLSEGLIIDAIGALLAYLVLQWIERAGTPWQTVLIQVVTVTAAGAILGFSAGSLARAVARTRLFDRELRNLSILALLMLCYEVAEHIVPQSGILASVVMGFTLSASHLPDIESLKAFKGQLTTLMISVLFVLLSGQLGMEEILALGWKGALAAVILILVVRPVSVFLSVWPNQLPLKERFTLAMTAPRGIVAAAVASLAARELDQQGIAGGALLEGLVYLAILATVAWSTVMSKVLPAVLGYNKDRSRQRAVVIGAHPMARWFAEMLRRTGRTTVVIDSVEWRLDPFRKEYLPVCGDARDAGTYEEAGIERDSIVVAATTNDELNLLAAELVHKEFGVEHPVVVLQRPPEDLGTRSRAWIDLMGDQGISIPTWNKRSERGEARPCDIQFQDEEQLKTFRDLLARFPDRLVLLAAWRGPEVIFRVDLSRFQRQRLTVLISGDEIEEALLPMIVPPETETELEAPPMTTAAAST